MASLLQLLGALVGVGNTEPLVSGNTVLPGSSGVAFHLDVHESGVVGQQVLVASSDGAVMQAPNDERGLMIGGTGDDRLIGGDHADLLIGGAGRNVMSGGGGTDTFGHALGATDLITDFSPAAGERIALQDGVSLSSSITGIVDPANSGLAGTPVQSTVMDFSDGSQVTLLHTVVTPDLVHFI
ncbi:MAG TPA: hypothetical protein VK196_11940 [Magnetospirillum sp.]|nr:hypothetical protein [Magnetospirillum sp.]